jgi:four helix bundle protein
VFDFQKLDVYQKAKSFCKDIAATIATQKFDRTTNDQLRRASFSIMLNIAEGASRFSNKDRRNFLVISRGSVFECVAILEYLKEVEAITSESFQYYYCRLEELSKMLFALIRRLEEKQNTA